MEKFSLYQVIGIVGSITAFVIAIAGFVVKYVAFRDKRTAEEIQIAVNSVSQHKEHERRVSLIERDTVENNRLIKDVIVNQMEIQREYNATMMKIVGLLERIYEASRKIQSP